MTESQNSKSLIVKGFAAVLIVLSVGTLAFQLTTTPNSSSVDSYEPVPVSTRGATPTPQVRQTRVNLLARKPGPLLVASSHPLTLSAQQQMELKQVMKLYRLEEACQQKIDLKVENVTLDGLMARIKPMLAAKSLPLQVREMSAVQLSFDLKQTRVGDILANVAALGGSRLYVSPDGLFIAPEYVLSERQQWDTLEGISGEWMQGGRMRGPSHWVMNRINKLLTQRLSQELVGKDVMKAPNGMVKTTVGRLSPSTQMLLSQMIDCITNHRARGKNQSKAAKLDTNSPLTVEFSEKHRVWVTLLGKSPYAANNSNYFDAFYGYRPKGKGKEMMQWATNKSASEVTTRYLYRTDSARVVA